MILAIDPGTKRTGWVLINDDPNLVELEYMIPAIFGISKPCDMRPLISKMQSHITTMLIEKPV